MNELKEKQTQLDDDLRWCVEQRFKRADLMRFSFADEVIDMLTEMSDGFGGEIDAIADMYENGIDDYFTQLNDKEDDFDFYCKHAADIERFLNECEDEYGKLPAIERPCFFGTVYLMLNLVITKLYFLLESEGCFE